MGLSSVDHFVVLMMENRSFDHLLSSVPGVDGATTLMTNPDTTGTPVAVTFDADFESDLIVDPGHDFVDVNEQVFGDSYGADSGGNYNQGFITNYAGQAGNLVEHASCIMKCHSGEHVPVLTALASQFAVCTRWFCSVPGPTLPNRLFVHAAYSDNRLDMDPTGYTAVPSVYDRLNEAGRDWSIYAQGGMTLAAMLAAVLEGCDTRLLPIDEFYRAAKNGRLPFYSFLEPRYSDYEDEERFIALPANDQHPNHDIRYGEHLIADVYEALRDSPAWPRTAFIILYDEHGGTFDHIKPPTAVSPRKEERYTDPADGRLQFAWDRLGPRVPAVVISPLVEPGTIDDTVYDHTSVFRTLRERDNSLKPLTERDAAANGFGHLFRRDTPRTDRPTVERPSIRFRTNNSTRSFGRLLSTHNVAMVKLASHLTANLAALKHSQELRTRGAVRTAVTTPAGIKTEADAAAFIRRSVLRMCPQFTGHL